MISFKHKWIFYALSILLSSIAAHESIRLLFIVVLLELFLMYKKLPIFHLIVLPLVSVVAYCCFSFVLSGLEKPLELPTSLTWTDEYKLKEDTLRGFMKDEEGRRIYVVYKIPSEKEKSVLQQTSLAGAKYWIEGQLEKPSKPNHQFSFNMDRYLKSEGAIGIVKISNWQLIDRENTIIQKINHQRFKLKQHIQDTFPDALVGEAQALLIGLQENVDDHTTRAYQKLGITHLFAISGLHIAIVSFIFYECLLRLKVRKELASFLLMIILPIYGILAGGAPSVWRAVTIVELIMISKIKGRLSTDDALAITFIFFVFLQPWSIYQIGFQLSYLATASLIYSSSIIQNATSWFRQSFLITFVCQLLVYPLLLFHFYEISLSSFIVNIFFVPLFSFIILPINIVLLFLSYLPNQLSSFFFICYTPLRELLASFINLLQNIPYQMWNAGKPSLWMMIICYLTVFVAFSFMDLKRKWYKILPIICLPVILFHFDGKLRDELTISFINVGQGDCMLIELPHDQGVYLIDTGGLLRFEEGKENGSAYEVGRDVVVPFLKGKGIHKIDKLILTHADADHVEGAEEVVQEINVGEIHISPNSYYKEVMADLLNEAKKQNIPIVEQMANHSWQVGQVYFHYLWPKDLHYEGNNDSLVLFLSTGQFHAMFMGDVEEEGEGAILKEYPALPQIDVLKAGHHGSKTSSSEEFLQHLQPTLTIFSAGENNRYGHPHEEVVTRYEKLGLRTLSTSEVGTIELTIDGEQMKVTSSLH